MRKTCAARISSSTPAAASSRPANRCARFYVRLLPRRRGRRSEARRAMREIVLDTETTGLDPFSGHRVVEIGCIELANRIPTGATYHIYLNPERDMPKEAEAVHGLSIEFLADKPLFAEIVDDLFAFLG